MSGIIEVNCINALRPVLPCPNKVMLGIDFCDVCKGEEE